MEDCWRDGKVGDVRFLLPEPDEDGEDMLSRSIWFDRSTDGRSVAFAEASNERAEFSSTSFSILTFHQLGELSTQGSADYQ